MSLILFGSWLLIVQHLYSHLIVFHIYVVVYKFHTDFQQLKEIHCIVSKCSGQLLIGPEAAVVRGLCPRHSPNFPFIPFTVSLYNKMKPIITWKNIIFDKLIAYFFCTDKPSMINTLIISYINI